MKKLTAFVVLTLGMAAGLAAQAGNFSRDDVMDLDPNFSMSVGSGSNSVRPEEEKLDVRVETVSRTESRGEVIYAKFKYATEDTKYGSGTKYWSSAACYFYQNYNDQYIVINDERALLKTTYVSESFRNCRFWDTRSTYEVDRWAAKYNLKAHYRY